ncbi:hypothetical protein MMC14_007741 [Varicellaria rhodocarpa]|nr:hypothetical protein [Varicellaria rhodocarpa]
MAKHQATIHGKLSAQHHNSLTDDQGEIDPLDDINKSGIHENCRDCDEDEEALEDDEEGEAIEVDEDEEGIGIIDPLHKFPKNEFSDDLKASIKSHNQAKREANPDSAPNSH